MPSAASSTKLPGSWTVPPPTWMTISPSPSVSPSSNIDVDATMLAVAMLVLAFVAAAASPLAASAMGWPVVWGHMYA